MASPAKIREVLLKLMGAKGENVIARGMDPESALPPSISRDLDTFPDRETYYGRPPDDLNAAELGVRQARQQARDVQGEDPLATSIQETQPIGSLTIPKELKMQRVQNLRNKGEREAPQSFMQEHWSPSPSRTDKGPADLKRTSPKDPSRLPDAEVPGSNEAITTFESVMDMMAGKEMPSQDQMGRLQQIAPDLYEIAKKEYDNFLENLEMPF